MFPFICQYSNINRPDTSFFMLKLHNQALKCALITEVLNFVETVIN